MVYCIETKAVFTKSFCGTIERLASAISLKSPIGEPFGPLSPSIIDGWPKFTNRSQQKIDHPSLMNDF